jgi:asparagine synthase (glutamine-hydrolysing)
MGCTSVPNRPDELALHHYLSFRFVPSPFTGFRGIRKIPPAHLLVWEGGRSEIRRYWGPPVPADRTRAAPPGQDLSSEQAAEQLRTRLSAAVRRRLESDVPLGLLLSGGLDSSVIAVEMARALGSSFETFSVGFPGTDYDESHWAEKVARHVGADHHAVRVTPAVTSALPRLVHRYGEPFADSSALAVEALARAVRPSVTVALGGDGGDELLGGYDRYRALSFSALLMPLGAPVRGALARPLVRAIGLLPIRNERRGVAGRAVRFLEALGLPPDQRNEDWLACFTEAGKHHLYDADLAGRMTGVDSFNLLRCHIPENGDTVAKAMQADLLFTLPDRMLFKLDGATMSVGLEARCPFLDTALVEWIGGLPSRIKVPSLPRRRGKPLLRLAYREELPREILHRKKAGFGLPVDVWLRGPLREMAGDLLGSDRLRRRGLFNVDNVGRLLEEHDSGAANHDDRLWTLLCLELWFREFIDRRAEDKGRSDSSPPARLPGDVKTQHPRRLDGLEGGPVG